MGAGAGFPGLALAISLKSTPDAQVVLVEANGKKCNFLRTVIRELNLPAKAVQTRIENFDPQDFDVITARAFAALPKLLEYSLPFWVDKTTALLPKGENWQSEVDAAHKVFDMDLGTTPSQTNENAKILTIKNLRYSPKTNKDTS